MFSQLVNVLIAVVTPEQHELGATKLGVRDQVIEEKVYTKIAATLFELLNKL